MLLKGLSPARCPGTKADLRPDVLGTVSPVAWPHHCGPRLASCREEPVPQGPQMPGWSTSSCVAILYAWHTWRCLVRNTGSWGMGLQGCGRIWTEPRPQALHLPGGQSRAEPCRVGMATEGP